MEYDLIDTPTIEFNMAKLSSMITKQAIDDGWFSEKFFIDVAAVAYDEENEVFVTQCEIYKYKEH